jgi:hypothetical protein
MLVSSGAQAQPCSDCSQILSSGTRSCQTVSIDLRAECERRAQEASARCYRTCTNYNGIGPQGRSTK